MTSYNVIASTAEETVVAEYEQKTPRADAYQSEAALEQEFISNLKDQGYEYLPIKCEADLIQNLRRQLEKLNKITFSDKEWKQFFNEVIANEQEGILEKTRKIQRDHIQLLRREDGTTKNIYLIDKENIHNNSLQVINQFEQNAGESPNRYDVTILVNGLPLVHVELKRRGVSIREAFNQIKRYQRESFGASKGLFEFVQIFVISNGTETKYYSNTTRNRHITENQPGRRNTKKTSNSFEFTSYWADARNENIFDLVDFTRTFFAKHSILNLLVNYCIFTSEDALLVMRPYQVVATERILNRILVADNNKLNGKKEGGGYIWHTTGSGKTVTSFKTAQLATKDPSIDKVLFVVDRADLDYQTMKEYDKFEKDCANSNANTRILERQLEDQNARIIITTIQKLSIFVKRHKIHEVYGKHVVFIFDECHRSQFGDMHALIRKTFKNYNMFGFTGTPIFAANSLSRGAKPSTTEQLFGDRLHTYTVVNAIKDHNVLPFRIDYVNTTKAKDIKDEKVQAIDTEKALEAPERIKKIATYILEHFDQKTKRNVSYQVSGRHLKGFNSILACSSIDVAKKFYTEIKKQLKEQNSQLKVATIFTYFVNEEDVEDQLGDVEALDVQSKDFLKNAINDYNQMFSTSFGVDSDKFQNYYKDISQRMKNRDLDLLIVVDMFLTGFDATTLNTLWVDKNLQMHGLIQAFSRTNRILNTVKAFGNIICFRDLAKAVDDALALFGDKDAGGIVILKTFDEYYKGYDDKNGNHIEGYEQLVKRFKQLYETENPLMTIEEMKNYVRLFNAVLRVTNILTSFDDFEGKELLTPRELQDYQGRYLKYRDEINRYKPEKEDITDDIEFELELVRELQVSIDYILMLVEKCKKSLEKNREVLLEQVRRDINASPDLRSKRELIERFIEQVNLTDDESVQDQWIAYTQKQRASDLDKIIKEERLKPEATKRFVDLAFRDDVLRIEGTGIDEILPPASIFVDKTSIIIRVIGKLLAFFEKYSGIRTSS